MYDDEIPGSIWIWLLMLVVVWGLPILILLSIVQLF